MKRFQVFMIVKDMKVLVGEADDFMECDDIITKVYYGDLEDKGLGIIPFYVVDRNEPDDKAGVWLMGDTLEDFKARCEAYDQDKGDSSDELQE